MSEPRLTAANPAATAAAEPPLEPPGTRVVSWGLRVGPNAEFSVLEPIANSSRFVLPITTAPASRSRVTTVASYGGFQPSRIRRRAGRRDPTRAHVVLEGDRYAGEQSRVLPGSDGLVDLDRPGPGLVGQHQVERVDVTLPPIDLGEMSLHDLRRGDQAVAYVPGDVDRGRRRIGTHQSSSPTIGGTRNRPSSAAGAAASTSSRSRPGQHDVLTHHVGDRSGVRHRLHPVEVEGVDVGEVVEHVAQLMRRLLQFLVAQRQPSELGHLGDRLRGDAIRHDPPRYPRPDHPDTAENAWLVPLSATNRTFSGVWCRCGGGGRVTWGVGRRSGRRGG